jgi:hypothetical protein
VTCIIGLVRFVPKSNDSAVLIGQPVDPDVDVGKAVRKGDEVQVKLLSGTSALNPGSLTDKVEVISRILSPLSAAEVGTIRCIGLNVCEQLDPVSVSVPVTVRIEQLLNESHSM